MPTEMLGDTKLNSYMIIFRPWVKKHSINPQHQKHIMDQFGSISTMSSSDKIDNLIDLVKVIRCQNKINSIKYN